MVPSLFSATSVYIIAFGAAPPVDIDGFREPVSGSYPCQFLWFVIVSSMCQDLLQTQIEIVSKLCSSGSERVVEAEVERRLLGLAVKSSQMTECTMSSWFGLLRGLSQQKQGSPAVELGLKLVLHTMHTCALGILVSRFAEYLEFLLTLLKKFSDVSTAILQLVLSATNTILERTGPLWSSQQTGKITFSLVSKVAGFAVNQGLKNKEQKIISVSISVLFNVISFFPHTLRQQLLQGKQLLLQLPFEENQFTIKNKFDIAKIISKFPGVQGSKQFASVWNELFYGTMKSLNRLLSLIFLDIKEGEFNRLGLVISELLDRNHRQVEPIVSLSEADKLGEISSVGKKIFMCMQLIEGLASNSSMEAAVQLPTIAMFQLLERCLLMNDLWTEAPQAKQVQVMSILPIIYTTALRLSMVVVRNCGDNAIMHYVTWTKCLKIQLDNSSKLNARQRGALYASCYEFLRLAGPGAVSQIYSAVYKCVVQEFIVCQEPLVKSTERPKKKQKLQLVQEVKQQQKEAELNLQFKSEVQTKNGVLKLLLTCVDYGGTLLEQQTCLRRSALVVKLFQYCWNQLQEEMKFGNDVGIWKKLLQGLLAVMVCEIQRECRYRLPYTSLLIAQLKTGISHADHWFSQFCVDSLQSLESGLHPRSTSVFQTVENCIATNQSKNKTKFDTTFGIEIFVQEQVDEPNKRTIQLDTESQDNRQFQENRSHHQQVFISSMQGESPSKKKNSPVNNTHGQEQVLFTHQAGAEHPTTQHEISIEKGVSIDKDQGVPGIDYIPATQEHTQVTQEQAENREEITQSLRFQLDDSLQQNTEDDDQLYNLSQKSGTGWDFQNAMEEKQQLIINDSQAEKKQEEKATDQDEKGESDDELPEIDSGPDDGGDLQSMETE
eukprot:TRINITY_DN989_c0_g1_i3.p1 TRINITY_DN989_c0_g1~~TRINITY_DN989_c0_g1_i3.p1  ORF type:complete len:889 (-),score=101.23 TRINITY_DN989_c0_g1_i3:643-3309(-)